MFLFITLGSFISHVTSNARVLIHITYTIWKYEICRSCSCILNIILTHCNIILMVHLLIPRCDYYYIEPIMMNISTLPMCYITLYPRYTCSVSLSIPNITNLSHPCVVDCGEQPSTGRV